MKVQAGDQLVLELTAPFLVQRAVLYYELLLPDGTIVPALEEAKDISSGVAVEALRARLHDAQLLSASAGAESSIASASGIGVVIRLRRRSARSPEDAILLARGWVNGRNYIRWGTTHVEHGERITDAVAVNPVPISATALRWTVPAGVSARLSGFQLSANVVAGTNKSTILVRWAYAGLPIASATATQPLIRPSTPIVVGSQASLSYPQDTGTVVVPLPSLFAAPGTEITIEITNPAAGDTLSGDAFGAELIARG